MISQSFPPHCLTEIGVVSAGRVAQIGLAAAAEPFLGHASNDGPGYTSA